MKAELQRREGLETRLAKFLQSRPQVWIPMAEMHAAGDAWRSRLPAVRRKFLREGIGIVRWNGKNGAGSAYMYLPNKPIGRDPSTPVSQPGLF